MKILKNGFILLVVFALASCGGGTPTEEAPPLFIMEQPLAENHNFVNFSIDEIEILGKTGDPVGMGEFRLLIIGADTDGRSSGMYCPGNEPIKVRTGDVVPSPCLFTIGFDESKVGDGFFLMVIVIDEDESSLGADLTYDIITNKLGEALGKAIGKNILKIGTKSTPVTIAASVLFSFTAGKVKNWVEKADIIGTQGVFLSRSDNWSTDKQMTVTSADSGIRFSYTVVRSSTSQSNSPVPPTKVVPTPKPSGPEGQKVQISCAEDIIEVNLRKSPGYQGKDIEEDRVVKVPCGVYVEILDGPQKKDDLTWWYISWDGYKGWMADHTSKGRTILLFNQ